MPITANHSSVTVPGGAESCRAFAAGEIDDTSCRVRRRAIRSMDQPVRSRADRLDTAPGGMSIGGAVSLHRDAAFDSLARDRRGENRDPGDDHHPITTTRS